MHHNSLPIFAEVPNHPGKVILKKTSAFVGEERSKMLSSQNQPLFSAEMSIDPHVDCILISDAMSRII